MAEIALVRATAILRQTIGVLSHLVFKEGSRLSCSREDIVWIEREMRHIQAYLEDAEAKQGGSKGVANLVIDIQDFACDVDDIMQKYFPRIASHRGKGFWGCLKSTTCIVCYGYDARNFVVEIEGIKRRVEDINRVRQTYGINEYSACLAQTLDIALLPIVVCRTTVLIQDKSGKASIDIMDIVSFQKSPIAAATCLQRLVSSTAASSPAASALYLPFLGVVTTDFVSHQTPAAFKRKTHRCMLISRKW
ncbi:hypothetical protein HYC85_015982 [Camellia sinensis]|uniref:Disease resistance N-terminal domain-containing protein n=1 Tax=Camellia sinensis TaxID=4442 RepID=A0A7J7H1Q7_CAMSI|nr:hypothetical protein HYC85_015982 [Camellia sinensis]